MENEKISELARDILKLSRNTLLVNLRFMDAALSQLHLFESCDCDLATDGRSIAYNPLHILRQHKLEQEIPVRDYLHIVLHCVFRHMFVHTLVDPVAWDLACDIAVECTISELGIPTAAAKREAMQQSVLSSLKSEVGQLTAEKIYRYYLESGSSPTEMAELRGLFYADNHLAWHSPEEGAAIFHGTDAKSAQLSESDWKKISEHMQVDMETFSKSRGDRAGSMIQNLREVNRERYDYSEFLRKFAVQCEVSQISHDEFDYIFYTYGLKLYKRMPLIEPLEYKEAKRIKEFVIAIDTSGSVSGDTVQSFVQKTYNILQSTESFHSKINLHIIQCDAEIQEDAKITSKREFDKYLETMEIHGLGGTDFRPVFEYVEQLRNQKEFINLKGLIYFTDGYGTFPSKMPDYKTAFVFVDNEYNNPDIPPWAIRLVLRQDEI